MKILSRACLLLVPFLVACSGQPTESHYYLLRPAELPESRALDAGGEFALGRVEIAPYLDRPGILLATRSGEMHPARWHQWAEPLNEGVHTLLLAELSEATRSDILPVSLNPDATVIQVRIDQLHGTADGSAVLAASWWFRRDGVVIAPGQFSGSRALVGEGYAALVSAEKALIGELASAIAAGLPEDAAAAE